MHWFWRGTIAAVVGFLFGLLSVGWMTTGFTELVRVLTSIAGIAREPIPVAIVFFVPCAVLVFSIDAALIRMFPSVHVLDCETRCCKCGYILRGITEPRCPECGERV